MEKKTMNEIKVFRMDEYCCYAGKSEEEVIKKYMDDTGMTREELIDPGGYPWIIPDEEMETLFIIIEDENQDDAGKRTFKKHLETLIDDGVEFPCLFGGTES